MCFRLSLLLAIIGVTHLPTTVLAQRTSIGFGAGVSRIEPKASLVGPGEARASIAARAGIGGSRVMLVLEWQRHGLGDEQPLASDYQNGITTRVPQILRTEFLLLGAQVYLARGFYVRPSAGVASNAFAVYNVPDGIDAQSAEVSSEGALTAGLSAGYHLRLHRHFSLAIEASVLGSPGEDSGEGRTVYGIQVTPLLEF
jgi:hypothetical protein